MVDETAGYPDRTRRAWDALQVHVAAVPRDEIGGWWVAIRMSDGGSDGNLYRSKGEAAKYQIHEQQCCYVCIPPFGHMTIRELHTFIEANQRVYDGGGRLSDEGTHIVPTELPIRRPV